MKQYTRSLDTIFLQQSCRRRRISSYDRTGGNMDWIVIAPGETREIARIDTCGIIRHIWCTMGCSDPYYLRKVLFRCFWDHEASPSVEVPIGDFFGAGHCIRRNYVSEPLIISPHDGMGFNCFFPMPFAACGQLQIVNESREPLSFYYYVDYEEHDGFDMEVAYFHSQWLREADTHGWKDPAINILDEKANGPAYPDWYPKSWTTQNLDGKDNYVILEAEGKGHYVGCNLQIDCFSKQANDWYGEGDDMIFIDGDPMPTLYGTGTEDYFNTAYGPREEFCTPWHGITLYSGHPDSPDWRFQGKQAMYRFHIKDPIYFEKSIRVTIEHGHANKLSNDYASTAYWYQGEPHKPFPPILEVSKRIPR